MVQGLRVLYLHQYFKTPAEPGGVRSYEIAKRFSNEYGLKVCLITTRPYGSYIFPRKESVENIEIWSIKSTINNKSSFFSRILSFIYFSFFCSIASLTCKYDFTYATSTPISIGIPALFAKLLRKKPYFFEVRDVWPEIPIAMGIIKNPILQKALIWFEKIIYSNSNGIVTLSTGMKKSINDRIIFNKPILVAPNFTREVDNFCEINYSCDGRLKFIYAGTHGIINNVSYAIRLSHELDCLGLAHQMKLVGDGMTKDSDILLAQSLGANNVSFHPSISKEEVYNEIANAHFAFSLFDDIPEMWANSANKFFDYLSLKKPVVINYGGWQKEVIESNSIGIALHPNDVEFAAKTLTHFILNFDYKPDNFNDLIRDYSADRATCNIVEFFKNYL